MSILLYGKKIVFYPFIPPAVTPPTISLDKKRYTIISGIMAKPKPKYIDPYSVLYVSVVNNCTSIGRVYFPRSLIKIKGIKKLFHDCTNAKRDIVAIAGYIWGKIILWNILSSLAPSILAESK